MAPRGGPGTLELENDKRPCSVCTKLFQRYRVYQPERWSVSLPTAMCQDCAAARQCCQVCYCDISTLAVNRVYSDTLPPGGSFLQVDVNADTLQKRYEGPFLQHMQKFVPTFMCRMTLMSLQNADEELTKEICSHLCVIRSLIDRKKHNNTTESLTAIHVAISLSPGQRSAFFLDTFSTCARIRAYLDSINGMCKDIQSIEVAKRHCLADIFRGSVSTDTENNTVTGYNLLKPDRPVTTGKQRKDNVQLANADITVIEHNSFSLKLIIKTPFLVELMYLLKVYTEVDTAIEITETIADIAN